MKRLVLTCGLLALAILSEAEELILVERGALPAYVIIISESASPSQRYAAEELQAFVAEMTDVRLPIVTDERPLPAKSILLGETRHTDRVLGVPAELELLGDDGFRLLSRSPHLLVLAGPVRGTLYGVYDLLERYWGCRWYTSWHGVIPKCDQLTIPTSLDDLRRPAFVLREPFWFDWFEGDFAARNKVNGGSMRLGKRHGGNIRFGNELFVHTFNTLCPPDEFFIDHPDYFSEIDGVRIKEQTQLCLTNPDVVRVVTDRLLKYIRKDPEAKLFSVSQNDWGNFCTCPSCQRMVEKEGSNSGPLIDFVNRVAEGIEAEFPGVLIETLAYQSTRKPPKQIRPRHNVAVRLCSIECDFSVPFEESSREVNREFVQDLRRWNELTDQLFVWDYTTNFSHYLSPFPNVRSLRGNIQLFRENGVVGVLKQGAYQGRHADFAELKGWLLAKWLWDPDLPIEPLLDDFFSGYYGAGASIVHHYFDEVHQLHPEADLPLHIFDPPNAPPFTKDFTARAVEMWREAEETVQDDPAALYNVRMGALSSIYARLAQLPSADKIRVWLTRNPQRFAVSPEQKLLACELLARCGEGQVWTSERKDQHEKVLAGWQNLLEFEPPPPTKRRRAIIEDSLLTLSKPGKLGERVDDSDAKDGRAIRLFRNHQESSIWLPFSNVATDPGDTYQLRIRLRVEKGLGQKGEAYWCGIYDPQSGESFATLHPHVDEVKGGYHWVEVGEWTPESTHFFWIGPGRFDPGNGEQSAIESLYVDRLDLKRIGRRKP